MSSPLFAGDPWLQRQFPNGVQVHDARGACYVLVMALVPSTGWMLCAATACDLWPWLAAALVPGWPQLQARLLRCWKFHLNDGTVAR